MTIYGSGFIPAINVAVNVTDPNGAVTQWTVGSDLTGSFSTTYQLGDVAGFYTVAATDGSSSATTIFHDASQSANLDQCTNGPVSKGVITPEPCLVGTALGGAQSGTAFANWVNGNSNAAKSHWREGEFIAYRTTLDGLSAGTHRLVIQYDTVHGGKHAIDYLGSFDATETTALSSTTFHYNFNNPCVDILGSTNCPQSPAPTPISTVSVPAASLVNCAGSAGGPVTQLSGSFKLFGSGGSILNINYPEQNVVQGTGQCSSQAAINFTVPSGVTKVVLTWGGHIASQADWGFGNSASAISGSPYHMALVSLDGASAGSQDRALATSAIFFTPTIATVIFDASTNLPVPGTPPTVSVGATVYDTATLTGASSSSGGKVDYAFFTNLGCTGGPSTNETVTVSGAVVPNSPNHGPLAAGSYSFQAFYEGDQSTNTLPALSGCEPLQVGKANSAVATHIFAVGTTTPDLQGTTQPLGTNVYDTAIVTATPLTPTGTVTYKFYSGTCGGTLLSTKTVTLSGGSAPNSDATGALAAGSYAFQAVYSGDSNYNGATSPCEPLTIAKGTSSTATHIFAVGTTTPDLQGTTQPLGTNVYDTAIVSATPFAPTGTVVYTFFNGACTGSVITTQTVTLSSGTVPNSAATGALAAGSYGFEAAYSGDSNYAGSTSACEPLTIAKASTSTATHIFVAGTTGPDVQGTSQPLGTSVYDTATVTATPFTATGTVTYTFYSGTCGGTVVSTKTVTLVSGLVPNSDATASLQAGSYAFQAVYSGDSNYFGSTSPCEPLTIAQAQTSTATQIFASGTTGPDIQGSTQPLGTSVYDTATVTATPFTATGTVTYTFYSGTCGGTVLSTKTVTLVGGAVPASDVTGALQAGSYAFQAVYSGDSNYFGSTSPCEPLTIAKASTTAATEIFAAGTTGPDLQNTQQPLGTSIYDTATVTASPFVPTGSVTYTFYSGTCGGTVVSTQIVVLSAGLVPNSGVTGPLHAGNYAFQAVYSGDSNYNGATSPCEPITILPQLEVIKVVNNGSPPPGIIDQPPGPSGFTMSVTGTGVSTSFPGSSSGTTMDIGLGGFSVSESPYNTPIPLGHYINVTYAATVTGDCSGLTQPFTGTITLAKDLFTCTVTNTAVYTESPNAQLIIVKNAVGGDGTFTYTVTGPSVPSIYPANPSITTVGGTGQFPTSTLLIDHGDYSISENAQSGWTLKMVTCSVNGGAPITETNGFTIHVDFGATVVCTFTNIKPSTSQVTDTSFCPFDVDSGQAGSQFRVILLPDPSSPSTYRMTATNPGQFYYNVFYIGLPGSAVNLQINIPWPFVTQGAQSVHVYNGTGTNSAGCLLQLGDVTSTFSLKGPSTSTSGGPVIQLSDYASQQNGQTQTIYVNGTEPSTGLAYVTIHVMWGLKGSAGWTKTSLGCMFGSPSKSCIGDAKNGTLTLLNNYAYAFSFKETNTGTTSTATANNENVFKNDPGIAGLITDSHGTPVNGAKVVVVGGGLSWTLYTDQDGFYQLVYKYTGKATTFTVTATFAGHTTSGSVTLKSNSFVILSLQFADL